jgi:hypothetical protein
MSTIEDFEEVDCSEEANPSNILPKSKSKTKPLLNKSKIPVLDSTCINSNTYDYEKLMSLISPNRIKESIDFESKRLNSLATPKRKVFEVADRLLYYQQLSDNRTRFKKIEQEHKEMENCTFSPKINNSNPRRSFSKFMEHQNDYQKIKRVKIDKKKVVLSKEKQGKDDLSPKIEISPGSQKINNFKKNKKSVHDRLYEDSKTYKKSLSVFAAEGLTQSFSPDCKSNKHYLIKDALGSEVFSPKSTSVCIALKKP